MASSRKKEENVAKIVVFGESGVGKTRFCDMFLVGEPWFLYSAIAPHASKDLTIDNELWSFDLLDLNSTLLRDDDPQFSPEFFENSLRKAAGIVLLYDMTSKASFDHVTDHAYMYAWTCRGAESIDGKRYLNGRQRFGCVLVGNRADVVKADPGKRAVSREMAEQWAQSQGFGHFEVSSNDRGQVEGAVEALARNIKKTSRWDARDIEEQKRMERKKEEESEIGRGKDSRQCYTSHGLIELVTIICLAAKKQSIAAELNAEAQTAEPSQTPKPLQPKPASTSALASTPASTQTSPGNPITLPGRASFRPQGRGGTPAFTSALAIAQSTHPSFAAAQKRPSFLSAQPGWRQTYCNVFTYYGGRHIFSS